MEGRGRRRCGEIPHLHEEGTYLLLRRADAAAHGPQMRVDESTCADQSSSTTANTLLIHHLRPGDDCGWAARQAGGEAGGEVRLAASWRTV